MKAILYKNYGPPDVLKLADVEKPTPKKDELLIKIYAATVNRTDCAMLRAKPFIMRFLTGLIKPKNPILGTDFAGTVEAAGESVKSFKTGDKVFGFDDNGLSSHAEYLIISENNAVAKIPGSINFEQAAASLEGVHYAYNFINKVSIERGQKVVVNGATGAIGSALVQLLKYYDADITAVCNSKDSDLMISLGAKKIIDYTKEDFTNSAEKYSFVFDTVGKSTFQKCRRLLLPGGIYMSSELGKGAQNLFFALITKAGGGTKVIFPFPKDRGGSILFIKKLIEEGKFNPVIDRSYPLEEIIEAFKYVEEARKMGNVIVRPFYEIKN